MAMIHILFKDMAQVKSHGLFHGIDRLVVLGAAAQTMKGFLVSMMMHYTNAKIEDFAIFRGYGWRR